MFIFLLSLGLFSCAWLMHLAWWRVHLPRHHTKALLLIFATVPVLGAALLLLTGWTGHLTLANWISAVLFYSSATLCYLITYAGVEETSPSLVLIRALEQAGAGGASRQELQTLITNERFILPRLGTLQGDGFVILDSGIYRLTERGRSAARFAAWLAALFNTGRGA